MTKIVPDNFVNPGRVRFNADIYKQKNHPKVVFLFGGDGGNYSVLLHLTPPGSP
jgi:hypothetical protein